MIHGERKWIPGIASSVQARSSYNYQRVHTSPWMPLPLPLSRRNSGFLHFDKFACSLAANRKRGTERPAPELNVNVFLSPLCLKMCLKMLARSGQHGSSILCLVSSWRYYTMAPSQPKFICWVQDIGSQRLVERGNIYLILQSRFTPPYHGRKIKEEV